MHVRYLAIAVSVLAAVAVAAQQRGADLVLVNGKVFTADPARPWAEAISIRMFAITHANNPPEAITREQAVAAYTSGSAFTEFAERDKGRIAAGMLADIAVLTQDIFTVEVNRLPATGSTLTIVNGRIVRDALTKP